MCLGWVGHIDQRSKCLSCTFLKKTALFVMVLLDTRWDADGDTTKLMLEALLGFLSTVSPAIRELLTRLKLLRAMVKLPPGWESGPSYCRHQHAQCCAHNKVHYPGWREEKSLEALTSDQTPSLMQPRDLGKVSRWRCVPYSGKTLIVVKHSPPLPNIPWELCQATGVITKWSCRGRQRDDSHNFSVIFLRNRDGSLTLEYIKISTYKWTFWKV